MLEFRLRLAEEKKAIVKEKRRDVHVSFKDLDERERERAESQERIVRKGEVYLENDRGERKATGSYYTPDHIVNYIVEHAVGPVVREKFDGMRQRLRDPERWHRDSVQAAKQKGEKPAKYETGLAVENRWRDLVNELFDLKILDPAMGSGHFLVETVDYITDKALDFLNSFPWNPVIAHLEMVRRTILDEMDEQGITIDQRRLTDVNLLKRHVLKRCIYGVDLNPMAVELAKVSLWLHCFTLGAPLSFLDHHVRCGNSLIGVSVAQVEDELRQGSLFGSQFAGLLLATDLMRHVGELSDVTSAQVRESREEYTRAAAALAPFRRILDVFTSQWFRDEARKPSSLKRRQSIPEVDFLKTKKAEQFVKSLSQAGARKSIEGMSDTERQIAERALWISIEKRPFHWELEFPEVFYGPRPGTERTIERLEDAGFDAVVGNPPYVRQETLKESKLYLAFGFPETFDATSDLYVYFLHREIQLLRSGGLAGLIVANKWLRVGYGRKLRSFLVRATHPVSIVDFGHSPIFPDADTFPCVSIFSKRAQPLSALENIPENEEVLACAFPREKYSPNQPIGPYVILSRRAIPTRFLGEREWSLEAPAVHSLLERFRTSGATLKELGAKPYRGTVSGLNEAFYIDSTTMERLVAEDARSREVIKPLLRGRDIDRWEPWHSGMYVIVSRRGINIDRYPAIKRHLSQFRQRLEPKPPTWTQANGAWRGRKPGDYRWFELQDNPYKALVQICDQPKITYQDIQYHCRFALDSTGAYPDATVYVLSSSDEGLLAVMNSSLMWWVLTRTLPHAKDEALRARSYLMEDIRVCLPEGRLRVSIVDCVKRIFEIAGQRHGLEELAVQRIKEFSQSDSVDRSALLWLHRSDDDFVRMVERTAGNSVSSGLRLEIRKLRANTNESFERYMRNQYEVEQALAVLVEDTYGLSDDERELLHATAPVREPIDVLKVTLAGRYNDYERSSEEDAES